MLASPDGSFVSTGALTWRYQVTMLVWSEICHRVCAYTEHQTVQRPAVYSDAHGTVHYKERLRNLK